MILTKSITKKLLIQDFNDLEIKYPHFAKDLLNTQAQIENQLDQLYDTHPTDLDIYHYLNRYDIKLADLTKILSYRDYKRLANLLK